MLQPCSVIYFPGIGGNFIKLCLSLSKETVPYYYQHLDSYTVDQITGIREITAEQRRSIIRYSTSSDYKKIHAVKSASLELSEPDFYYQNSLINDYFKWSIVGNHPSDYKSRLEWLKKIIYVELDLEKYGHWVSRASAQFGFENFNQTNYLLTADQYAEEQQLKNYNITTTLSMTNVLTGVDGFTNEYLRTCNNLEITPEIDQAILFYQDWRSLRVNPFI
jgi:hypothetical protein